ncbi:E1 ubiquitin-activating protein uba2 [Sorochytrium milnesiophthora]
MTEAGRYMAARRVLGDALVEKLRSARVLMVGAGGIGCELLKNLVMTGFQHIELVDLDTIDISNLNRQFLFQRQHVAKSKAHVAKETASKFNPDVQIVAHHANIKDARFHVGWMKQFDVVFNALDNLDARRHVNMMCMATDTPLIDAGTGGYTGQSTVILKNVTECYDCHPRPTPKSFPVCTIRSTPSAPIHCIVWAKNYLFSQLFGVDDDEASGEGVMDTTANADNAEEIAKLNAEATALKRLRSAVGTPEYAELVFTKIFKQDIERLLSMEDMWATRTPPTPLAWETLAGADAEHPEGETKVQREQRALSLAESFQLFRQSLTTLGDRFAANPSDGLSFDKDDEEAMDFVAATANLRAHVYGIEEKSRFEIKSMAGNIVPIVATTNAVIAGVSVMQALSILDARGQDAKTVYLVTRRNQVLALENLEAPNAQCKVCQRTYLYLAADVHTTTLASLLRFVHRDVYLELQPDRVSVMEGHRLLWDPDFDDNGDRTLSDLSGESEGEAAAPEFVNFHLTVEEDDDDNDGDQEGGLAINPVTVFVKHTAGTALRCLEPQVPELLRSPRPPKPAESEPASPISSDTTPVVLGDDDDDDALVPSTTHLDGNGSDHREGKAAAGDEDEAQAVEAAEDTAGRKRKLDQVVDAVDDCILVSDDEDDAINKDAKRPRMDSIPSTVPSSPIVVDSDPDVIELD